MANEQQKTEIFNQLSNFKALKQDSRLKNYIEKACAVLPDEEINFTQNLIKEIQKNCPHNGDKRIQPSISLSELKFEEKCSLCGHVTRQNVPVTQL